MKRKCHNCLIVFRQASEAQIKRPAYLCPDCGRRYWSTWTDGARGGVALCFADLDDLEVGDVR